MTHSSSSPARTPSDKHHHDSKIAVVGPGAMGCLLAASLERAGKTVALLDYRSDRTERLLASGITVEDKNGQWDAQLTITADPASLGVQDWVIVLVKAQDTVNVVGALSSIVGPKTLILSLQNGVGHEEVLSRVIRPEQIALGVTSHGATLLSEGHVRHAGEGPTRIGLIRPSDAFASSLVSLAGQLEEAGWSTEVVSDIRPHLWQKLVVNAGINALTALTGLTNGGLLDHPEALRLQELAVREVWAVAQSLGVITELSPEEMLAVVRSICTATANNRSSMLQDRLRRRPTEVAFINGAVVQFGLKSGIPTPVNEVLTLLIEVRTKLRWSLPCLWGNETSGTS